MHKIIMIMISAIMTLLSFVGLCRPPVGLFHQVLYQGELYHHNYHPDYSIPATLEKDAPALTYIGRITSISRKYALPTKELQGNHWDQRYAELYLHEDGYLYLFPLRGNAYTLTKAPLYEK